MGETTAIKLLPSVIIGTNDHVYWSVPFSVRIIYILYLNRSMYRLANWVCVQLDHKQLLQWISGK